MALVLRKIKSFSNLITDKDIRFVWMAKHGKLDNMPDEEYLPRLFKIRMGYDLNLDDPKTFNEKLQWLKIHDRKPIYTTMVDKYDAKKYVGEKLGEQYIVPTYGVWDKFEEIDFDKLPEQFVMKATHDSGGLIICRDKKSLDLDAARVKMNSCLKRKFGMVGREWPYLQITPRIIVEKYMEDKNVKAGKGKGLTDYKFFCFNGDPKYLSVSTGLEDHSTARRSFLSMDWQFVEFGRSDFKPFEELPEKPVNYDDMIRIARILSEGTKFLRVDLYEIDDQVYFGEMTFYPTAGFMPIEPPEWDRKLGDLINLND